MPLEWSMRCKRKKLDLVFCPRRVCKPCNGGKVLRCNWALFSRTLSHTARCNRVLFSQTLLHTAHCCWSGPQSLAFAAGKTNESSASRQFDQEATQGWQRGMKRQIALIFHILKGCEVVLQKNNESSWSQAEKLCQEQQYFATRFANLRERFITE